MALNEPEEPVIEFALALHRLRDEPPLIFERPGVNLLEGNVSLLHPAPELSKLVPVLGGKVPVQLLEELVFDLALVLQQIQDPLQLELLGALVLELALQVVYEHLLVPPLERMVGFDGDLVQPSLGARALHPFENPFSPAKRLSQLIQQPSQYLLVVALGHLLLRSVAPRISG